MSLSSTALKQREKEAKTLNWILLYSLIGSVVIHIGVMGLYLSKFLINFSKDKDEPIELTLIEVPNQELEKIPEIQKSLSKVDAGGSSVNGGGKSGQQQTSTDADATTISVIKQPTKQSSQQSIPNKTRAITSPIQKPANQSINSSPQPKPQETFKQVVTQPLITNEPSLEQNSSIKKLVERLKMPSQQSTMSTETSKPATNIIQKVPDSSASSTSINNQSNSTERSLTSNRTTGDSTNKDSSNSMSNGSGNGVGNGIGNGIGNGSGNGYGNGSGNGYGNGIGNGIGNGSGNVVGNGFGNGSGSQPGKENTTVATQPQPTRENNSRLERADCLKCDIKYPPRARRRSAEGNPEIAVDTDDNGNVTRVRLIRSSGDRELDEAAQAAAQDWKLKPISGGRQGVRASVNFAIKGSQRHRQIQERQRQREIQAAQQKPDNTANLPNPTSTPQPRQPSTAGVVREIPLENSTRRRTKVVPSPEVVPPKVESGTTNSTQQTSPPRVQQVNTPNQSQETKSEQVQQRRRQLEDILRRPQTSDSQETSSERIQKRRKRLEEILRRQQTSEPPTTDKPESSSQSPADATNNN